MTKKSYKDIPTEISVDTITEVDREEGGYEIRHGYWWCFLDDEDNSKNIVPKVGDKLILWLKNGSKIIGMEIDGNLLYLKTNEQLDREHEEWRQAVKEEHTKEYYELMEKIKNDEPFETIDITGFGSGYERAVQMMIRAGMKWLEKHPDFKFNIDQSPNIMGVASLKGDENNIKELDEAILAVNDGCSGMQHQATINHLKYIHEKGYQNWLDKFPKNRHYMYPKELPVDSFMRDDDDDED